MVKIRNKKIPTFEAFQWLGITADWEQIQRGEYSDLRDSVNHMEEFEDWSRKHARKKKFKLRGNNLIHDTAYGDLVVKPGMWVIIGHDEEGEVEISVTTDQQMNAWYERCE